ncbi:MAG: transcription antitermination factor NusB [Eubacteriales bacterium]|nr:transcription antitermination factor NusB [Eubacteriales bacterium]
MKRTEQREHIFKLIFGVEFNPPEELAEQIRLYFEQAEIVDEKDQRYIADKTEAVAAHIEEIDSLISRHSTGWKITRMNKADLSVLRLAVYEMKLDEDVPVSVAINEAVELAKRFGGEDSPSFINAVLAKMAD